MTGNHLKLRITDYFWPFGVSLLCGCFGLYLGTLGLFALGVPITLWHGLIFAVFALTSAYLAIGGDRISRWKKAVIIFICQLILCGILIAIASRFDDLSYDGMNARIEPVINLMADWNPIKDPGFSRRSELQEMHSFLKGGHNHEPSSGTILAAYLACLTGEVNVGKAVTPILGLAAFGITFGGLSALAVPVSWAVVLAVLAAMNPVIIYQSSSYYIDGHVAALFAATTFAGIRAVLLPAEHISKATFLLCLLLLAGAKNSGIFYSLILLLLILAIWLFKTGRKKKPTYFFGAAVMVLIFITFCIVRKKGQFPGVSREYLIQSTDYSHGRIGYKTWAPGLGGGGEPGRLGIFFNSYFSPTAAMANEPVSIKFPFWLNRRELAVFEDLSPQPCAGGFGPLYGAFFFLSAASLLLIRSKPPWISWLPLLASFGSIYFSQIWWARWTPQAWLIPLGFLLPVICSFRGQPPGKKWTLPFLAVFTGLLNSILILAFYTTGCIKSQITLESQLAYLRTLPGPLEVYMPRFQSNRIWFLREGIEFRKIRIPPEPPWLKLHRTATLVSLPAQANPQASVPPEVWENWNKRKLVDLGGFPPPGN
jgi:hypothetical protein